MSSSQRYDFTYSNLILTIGGQILTLVIIIMIVLFGVGPVRWSANEVESIVKPFIQKKQSSSSNSSSNSSSKTSSNSSSNSSKTTSTK